MALKYVRAAGTTDFGPSVTVPAAGHYAGSLLVLVLVAVSTTALSLSDSKSNTWTTLLNDQAAFGGDESIVVAWSLLSTALAGGDTISFGDSYAAFGAEYRGAAAAPADGSHTSLTAFGTTWLPGAITPAVANELLIAGIPAGHASTPAAGWTSRVSRNDDPSGGGSGRVGRYITIQDNVLSGGAGTPVGGAAIGTWAGGASDNSKAFIVSFKPDIATAVPVNTSAPTISGTTPVGSLLVCDPGVWTNRPDTFSFDWKRAGVPIGAPNDNTYTTALVDETHAISCTVTGSNAFGTSFAASSNSKTPTATHTGPFAAKISQWGQIVSEWGTSPPSPFGTYFALDAGLNGVSIGVVQGAETRVSFPYSAPTQEIANILDAMLSSLRLVKF